MAKVATDFEKIIQQGRAFFLNYVMGRRPDGMNR